MVELKINYRSWLDNYKNSPYWIYKSLPLTRAFFRLNPEIKNWLEEFNIDYSTYSIIEFIKITGSESKCWTFMGMGIIFENPKDELFFKLKWLD